jgi:guanosine-3',5'-bis(diphosphate) 3'-pyrophosphohydrolase
MIHLQAPLCEMFEFAELRDQLATYLSQEQVEIISAAYLLAENAHQGQTRSTGEPYIIHPIAVARILANIRMDYQTIAAALLHDVLEDTSISKADLQLRFGEKITELVDGVTKLAQIRFESKIEAQAENLRKMMMAMARDIRVMLIKLADRMHNMRTLDTLSREKQRRISLETLEIYSPIANRLGMHNFRVEFENLGFAYLYPVRFKVLRDAIRKARGNRAEIIHSIENSLKLRFAQENLLSIVVKGREKHIYSLYKKMRNKDLSLSDIMDVYALRVIVADIDLCYRVLGIVHNFYKPVHGRFKDYIAVPKSNGYQSLHTTVLGPHGVPVEIQIRTHGMDDTAENGICAHWLYKSFPSEDSDNKAQQLANEWLKGLLDIENSAGNSLEFIENVKIDLYPDEVYVFTPAGEILSLPNGATCVDFAFAVHTDVGNSCIAAKIDRRLVPLSTRLMSGQTVEIINAQGAYPNPAWLSFVVTGKARSNILHWLKTQQVNESEDLGRRLLERSLTAISIELNDLKPENISRVLKELKLEFVESLYQEIGLGNQLAPLVARRLTIDTSTTEQNKVPLAIKGTEGMVINYAKCCRPIPGDQILGFLSTGKGIVIHRECCKNVAEVNKYPEKYVFVQWSKDIVGLFRVELKVDVINKRGILATIASALSECNASIENVQVDETDHQHNILIFLIQIKDRSHLANIIRRVRSMSVVTKVARN